VRNPLRKLRPIKWFIQRGRRGWADCDVWWLHSHLERILAGALSELVNISHGHPCIYEGPDDIMDFDCRTGTRQCMCNHEWNVELYRNAELFRRLDRDEFWDMDEEAAVRKEATEWLAKRWGTLWD